jgi:RNA polymerase sigma-70 factor (ECF subfamily)
LSRIRRGYAAAGFKKIIETFGLCEGTNIKDNIYAVFEGRMHRLIVSPWLNQGRTARNKVTEIENKIWLERLRRREHDAFAELVQRYQQHVFMCCHSLGLDANEAEDVASETFLAVWKSIESFGGKSKLSTWLWSIAYHKTMDFLRQRQRTWEHIDFEDEAAATAEQGGALEAGLENEIVWSAVKKLPQPWPLAVVLFYREEKNIAEIADIMDVPENTVKTYLHRARQKLKESLKGFWRDKSQCA